MSGRSKWALLAALFLSLVLADQWTKYLAVERLTAAFTGGLGAEPPAGPSLRAKVSAFYTLRHLEHMAEPPYYVYRPLWRMNYVENPGAAWGLFRGLSLPARNALFTVISLGAVAFILHYYRRTPADQRWVQVALAFVLSGAVGNFVDRLARGYVIDFIEWYWWNRTDIRWPTFNIADSLIVVGVAMLLLHPGQRAGAEARDRDGKKQAASSV